MKSIKSVSCGSVVMLLALSTLVQAQGNDSGSTSDSCRNFTQEFYDWCLPNTYIKAVKQNGEPRRAFHQCGKNATSRSLGLHADLQKRTQCGWCRPLVRQSVRPSLPDALAWRTRGIEACRPDDELRVFRPYSNGGETLIAFSDKVVERSSAPGTHKGAMTGTPVTSRKVGWSETFIYRLADRKIVELWVEGSTLELLQQIGALPELGSSIFILSKASAGN